MIIIKYLKINPGQKLLIYFILALLLISSQITWADENHFQEKSLQQVSSTPSDLAKVEDIVWQPVSLPPLGEVTDIAIDPSDPAWIWLVGDAGGVVVSSDGGKTFRKGQTPREFDFLLHGKFITVSPIDSNYIVADADQGGQVSGMSYSTDRGKSWRLMELGEVRGPGDVYDAVFEPRSSQLVYAIKGSDLFLANLETGRANKIFTTSQGTLRTININPDSHIILVGGQSGSSFWGLPLGRSESFGPGSAKTLLYKSLDGSNWQEIKADLGSVAEFAFLNKEGSKITFAASTNGVFTSADDGDSWSKINHDFGPQGAESIAISADGSLISVGTRIGAWISSDYGKTWQKTNHAQSSREQFVDSVAIDSQNHIYLGSADGLFKSTDHGQNFSKLEGLYNYDILLLTIDPYDPEIIFTGTSCARGIHKSLDGGKTWQWAGGNDFTREFLNGLLNHYQMDIDISQSNPNIVWSTSAQGVYKSEDGGFTWQNIDNEYTKIPGLKRAHLPWWHFHGMGIHPNNPDIVIVGNGTGGIAESPGPKETFLIRSTDGGNDWEKIILSNQILSSIQDIVFDPFNPDIVYAPTHTEVWGEGTKQRAQGLFKSTDGGKTWNKSQGAGLHEEEISAFQMSHQTPNKIFVMGHSEDHDGSQSEEKASLHISDDGGENWQAITLPIATNLVGRHNSLVVDPTDDRHLLVAAAGGVLQSKDGGVNWQFLGQGISEGSGSAKYLNLDRYGSRLYLVLDGPSGPSIFQTQLKSVTLQPSPVERIQKSEDEQFSQSQGFAGILNNLESMGISQKTIITFAIIGLLVLIIVSLLFFWGIKKLITKLLKIWKVG